MLQSFQLDWSALQYGRGEVQKTIFDLKIAPNGKDSENRYGEYSYYSSGKIKDLNSIKKKERKSKEVCLSNFSTVNLQKLEEI